MNCYEPEEGEVVGCECGDPSVPMVSHQVSEVKSSCPKLNTGIAQNCRKQTEYLRK